MCVVAQDRRSGRASVVVVAESGDVEGGEGGRATAEREVTGERGSRVGLFVQTRGAGAYRRWEVLGRALGTSW